jgi:CRISPR-associated protein Cas1
MRTLYVDRRDAMLTIDGERLMMQLPEIRRPLSLPLVQLQTVVISATVTLTSRVLLKFSQLGVGLVVLNPRDADNYVLSLAQRHGHVARRIGQYAVSTHATGRLGYAKQLIRVRLTHQAQLLRRLVHGHPAASYRLRRAADDIMHMCRQCNASTSIASLRGLEGSAARVFFAGMADALPDWTQFTGRNRRPPKDAVNVLLSLTYSLIHAEAVRALCGAGLDPMLGFYHEAGYGRDSLACDLTELLRGRAEQWVMQLIHKQTLRQSHFSTSEQYPCILGKAGRAIYYDHIEQKMASWRPLLRRVARGWAQQIDQLRLEEH